MAHQDLPSRPPPNHDGATNDDEPVPRFRELQLHLEQLVENPSQQLDEELIDSVRMNVGVHNARFLRETFLPTLKIIIHTTDQDPRALFELISALMQALSFQECLVETDLDSLIRALQSQSASAAYFALLILEKAALSAEDIQFLASHRDIIVEILRTWLMTPHTGIVATAAGLISHLLTADCDVLPESRSALPSFLDQFSHLITRSGIEVNGINGVNGVNNDDEELTKRPAGNGVLWRLIFEDRDILLMIRNACQNQVPAIRETSIYQGRLLDLIPTLLDLNFRAISQTNFPDLFPIPEHLSARVGTGLLQWATLNMVDTTDPLMDAVLVGFYEGFVRQVSAKKHSPGKDHFIINLLSTAIQQYDQIQVPVKRLTNQAGSEEEANMIAEFVARFVN